ncbi:MAG: hypothetical protein GY852_11505 [bacterium]|nr:hypothetical protein [bacterium]
MDDLLQSMTDFLAKEPEKRFGELMAILNYSENAQAMGALGLVLPACTGEEQLIISQKLGDDRLEGNVTFPPSLIHMFFADARIEAGPDAISELCCSLLSHHNHELRENTLSLLEQGIFALDDHTRCQLILMLGDPEAKIRQLAADIIPIYSDDKDWLPERFFSTFYLEDPRAGKFLAGEIETHEDAVMFLYLCFAHSEFGHLNKEDSLNPSLLIMELYHNTNRAKIDFSEALSDALELFCARSASLNQLSNKEKAKLKGSLKKGVRGAVEAAGGEVPTRLPRPNKQPLIRKEQAKAKA